MFHDASWLWIKNLIDVWLFRRTETLVSFCEFGSVVDDHVGSGTVMSLIC